jgi:hypothetical protein
MTAGWHQWGIRVAATLRSVTGMDIQRGSALLTAVAVLATAGCARGTTTHDAAPVTTVSADSGFGKNPATGGAGAAATSRPTPDRTTGSPVRTTKSTPRTPDARPSWARLVQACPNKGQKTEIQQILEGDVTGDGRAETIVARTCEASTSYWPSTIEVFDGASDPLRPERIGEPLLAERHKEDEPVVTGLSINAGMIGVKAYGTSPKGTRACPDLKLFYRYEHQGDGFKLVWRDWGPGEKCE